MPVVNVYTLESGEVGTCRELYDQLTKGMQDPITYSTFRHRIAYGWRDRESLTQPRIDREVFSRRGGIKNKKEYRLDDGFSGTLGACYQYLKGRGWRLPPEKTVRDRLYRGITDIDRLRSLKLTGEASLPQKLPSQPLQCATKVRIQGQIQAMKETLHCRNPLPDCQEWTGWRGGYIRDHALDAFPELRAALNLS